MLFLFFLGIVSAALHQTCDPAPGTPVNDPIGEEKGIFPGRVVWDFRPDATKWDGKTSFFWKPQYTNQGIVNDMMDNLIRNLTGATNLKESWEKLFNYFNKEKFGIASGYKAGEKVVIKINLNGMWVGPSETNANQLTPQFLNSLLKHLTTYAGIAQEDISIYDASRIFPTFFWDAPQGIGENYSKVNLIDNNGEQTWTKKVQKDDNVKFYFSDKTVPAYDKTKLPKCVTAAKYMISVANFRGHILAGITATGKNYFGSIYRKDCTCDVPPVLVDNHWCPMSIHEFVNVNERPMGTYTVLPDLLGHPHLAGKGLLFFSEGLYGGATQDPEDPILFKSYPFNNHWSSSLLVSQDPIALDSVLFDLLRNEPNVPYAHTDGWCIDNYLHESALANDPPSGTVYNPSGEKQLESLGCHEHFNNAKDKQYTRNLGGDKGLELIQLFR